MLNLNIDIGLVNAFESVLLAISVITCYKAGGLEHHCLLSQNCLVFIVQSIQSFKHKKEIIKLKSSRKVTTFKIYHQVYCMLDL